jgi:intracellular septation protein A
MKSLLRSASFLLLDMASTFFYLAIFLITKSIAVSVAAGVGLGIGQVLWERYRGKPIQTMQWMSLFLVVASALATLLTHDARFVLIKPSVTYVIVGVVMLKPGWMNRYLPQRAIELVPDIAFIFGFVWAGLMFVTAVVNVVAAMQLSLLAWGEFMSAFALSTKIALFLIQYATMRFIAVRRHRAAEALGDAVPAQA